MKKYNLEIELFDDWDEALKKEYEITKEVLNNEEEIKIDYKETYEEFLSRIIRNILESASIYDYLDSYVDENK